MSTQDTPQQTSPLAGTALAPASTGYVDVNGLHMYYETYGSGTPLVLLHGGMLTIDINWGGLIPTLAERHLVIGVETQGHGRTADIDRLISPGHMASDVVGLLDHLEIERAHVMGHSMGGATTLQLAVSHPDRVNKIVPCSVSVRPEGMHPDLLDPSKFATSTRMPTQDDFVEFTEAYRRLSPHPENFDTFLAKLSSNQEDSKGWTDEELGAITAPSLFVNGDHDFVTVEHGEQILALVPGSQLAILPGTTHMQVTRSADLVLPLLARFLDWSGLDRTKTD